MSDLEKYIKDMSKASLILRFQRAIQDRLDSTELDVPSRRNAIKQLVAQRNALEHEQTALVKGLSYSMMAVFFLSSGADFQVPVIDLQLSEIPSVLSISVICSSLAYLFFCLKFVDVQAYSAAISAFSNFKNSDEDGLDHFKSHIEQMRHDKSSSWYQLLNSDYSYKLNETYELRWSARFFGAIIKISIGLLLLVFLLFPPIYLNYVAWWELPDSLITSVISVFVLISSILSLCVFGVLLISFRHTYADDNTRNWKE